MEGHLIGPQMHTAVQFDRPWGSLTIWKDQYRGSGYGRPRHLCSAMRLSFFLTPAEDAIDAILTAASGTLLISPDFNLQVRILGQEPAAACLFYPGWTCFLPSSFRPAPHLGAPVLPGRHECFPGTTLLLRPGPHSPWQSSCFPVLGPPTDGHARRSRWIIDRPHRFAHTCPWYLSIFQDPHLILEARPPPCHIQTQDPQKSKLSHFPIFTPLLSNCSSVSVPTHLCPWPNS